MWKVVAAVLSFLAAASVSLKGVDAGASPGGTGGSLIRCESPSDLNDKRIYRTDADTAFDSPWISNQNGRLFYHIERGHEIASAGGGKVRVSTVEPDSSLDLAIPSMSGVFRVVSLGSSGAILDVFWLSEDALMVLFFSEGRTSFAVADTHEMTLSYCTCLVTSNESVEDFLTSYHQRR